MARTRGTGISARRNQLRTELFPGTIPWRPSEERGFFAAPRTLPLILALLKSSALRGNEHLGTVYLDLFARNMGEGIIQMSDEADHAYAAGYSGSRAIRTWRERMAALEALGLIQSKARGNRQFGFVLLVHPTVAVLQLRARGVVPDEWWTAFRSRQQEIGDTSLERCAAAPGPEPASSPTSARGAA